jgi:predicted flap endonuclease-1-like 5' DNA nuclease
VTNAEGGFLFAELAPGTYTVMAQLGDLSAQTQVTVPGTFAPPLPPMFDPGAFPGRTLAEVSGIGPAFRARLEENGITHPAEVASMEAARLAEILQVAEGRANSLIANARRLLTA